MVRFCNVCRLEGKTDDQSGCKLFRLPKNIISAQNVLKNLGFDTDFIPNLNFRICENHFTQESIIKGMWRLVEFPQTIDPAVDENDISEQLINSPINDEIEAFSENNNKIQKFEELKAYLEDTDEYHFWEENWNVFMQSDGICFYRLSRNKNFDDIEISFKILVNSKMQVILRNDCGKAAATELKWILKCSKLELWSQLHEMLDYYQSEPEIKLQSNRCQLVSQTLDSLDKTTKSLQVIKQMKATLEEELGTEEPRTDDDEKHEQPEQLFLATEAYDSYEDDEVVFAEILDDSDADFEELEIWKEEIKLTTSAAKRKQGKSDKLSSSRAKQKYLKPKSSKPSETKQDIQCEECGRVFKSSKSLICHMLSLHTQFEPVYCDKCGAKLKSINILKSHMMRHDRDHYEKSKVKCPQCGDIMLPESLRRHIRVKHERYKPFKCSSCNKFFSSKFLVKEHERVHATNASAYSELQADSSLEYRCPKCAQTLKRGGQTFQKHMERCSGHLIPRRRKNNFSCCVKCQKPFRSKLACAEHMALVHEIFIENVEKFCFICNAEFDNPYKHSKKHNCPFACKYCSKRFISEEKLESHESQRHPRRDDCPFTCDICDGTYKTKNNLTAHLITFHS